MDHQFQDSKRRRQQRGAVLILCLLLLIALTMVSLSGMTANTIAERMAGNTRDHTIALEAAEAGLRDGETDVNKNLTSDQFGATCSAGLCPTNSETTPLGVGSNALFASSDWSSSARSYGAYTGATAYTLPDGSTTNAPRYIVELLPPLEARPGQSVSQNKPHNYGTGYRVTALGEGLQSQSKVLLQSIYVKY